ncbi:MAG: hypothetical protein QF692_05375 [Alphaproteobacteria bacterium]|jgi:hypothetical protein|nr:hypothetical protein [Alphaproteobacteria bacterium]MDP7222676.1 hypothetical protein [Alphaproteobacteria bacterium]
MVYFYAAVALVYFLSFALFSPAFGSSDLGDVYIAVYHLCAIAVALFLLFKVLGKVIWANLLSIILIFSCLGTVYGAITESADQSKIDAFYGFKKQNFQIVPAVFPQSFMPIFEGDSARPEYSYMSEWPETEWGEAIFPLSGLSNKPTLNCKEDNGWHIYDADRYGFNNPDWVWDKPNGSILFLGDSFVNGACLEKNMIYGLRNKLDHNVIGLGLRGSSPLVYYATYREFLEEYEPQTAVFVFSANDFVRMHHRLLIDFSRELRVPILKTYLTDKNFTQHYFKQYPAFEEDYNRKVNAYIESYPKQETRLEKFAQYISGYFIVATVKKRYQAKGISGQEDVSYYSVPEHEKPDAYKLLDQIHDVSKQRGVHALFVFIPHKYGCMAKVSPAFYEDLFIYMNKNNILYLNLFDEYYDQCDTLFTKVGGHFSETGSDIISTDIAAHLRDMSLASIKE